MTKFLASQCGNGRTVDLPLAGKFKKVKQEAKSAGEQGDDAPAQMAIMYAFMPHLDFVGSGHFKYP